MSGGTNSSDDGNTHRQDWDYEVMDEPGLYGLQFRSPYHGHHIYVDLLQAGFHVTPGRSTDAPQVPPANAQIQALASMISPPKGVVMTLITISGIHDPIRVTRTGHSEILMRMPLDLYLFVWRALTHGKPTVMVQQCGSHSFIKPLKKRQGDTGSTSLKRTSPSPPPCRWD